MSARVQKQAIGEAALLERVERSLIGGGALRLDEDRLVPVEPEPAQVLEDAVDELGPAAGLVEILDPQQEFAAALRARWHGRARRYRHGPRCSRPVGEGAKRVTIIARC